MNAYAQAQLLASISDSYACIFKEMFQAPVI